MPTRPDSNAPNEDLAKLSLFISEVLCVIILMLPDQMVQGYPRVLPLFAQRREQDQVVPC